MVTPVCTKNFQLRLRKRRACAIQLVLRNIRQHSGRVFIGDVDRPRRAAGRQHRERDLRRRRYRSGARPSLGFISWCSAAPEQHGAWAGVPGARRAVSSRVTSPMHRPTCWAYFQNPHHSGASAAEPAPPFQSCGISRSPPVSGRAEFTRVTACCPSSQALASPLGSSGARRVCRGT
jgi:hypothetical protein